MGFSTRYTADTMMAPGSTNAGQGVPGRGRAREQRRRGRVQHTPVARGRGAGVDRPAASRAPTYD